MSKPHKPGAAPDNADIANGRRSQTIYLRDLDTDRALELEYIIRRSARQTGQTGRVGLSLIVRAGLAMLTDAMKKNELATLAFVARVARGEDEGQP